MNRPRTVAILQGRMSSSRLPGKILLDIGGKPMLQRVYERARRAASLDQVLIATTTDPSDDPVEAFCSKEGLPCFRGSLDDVLDRFYQAARQAQAEFVVRLTGDCPVIDPRVIDLVVEKCVAGGYDFAANRLPPPFQRTYPIGLDVEVCSFAALARAWQEAHQPYHREHVMPYLYEEPGRFKVLVLDHEPDYGAYRWTVDTPEDLEAMRTIYARFAGREDFGWEEVLALYKREPELAQVNAGIHHRSYLETDPSKRGQDA